MELSKKEAAQILSDAIDDKRFFGNDGRVFGNLDDLADYLESLSPEIFTYHVSAENNDFSNWVRDVLGDNELADKLGKASDQAEAAKTVRERLKWLKKKAS